MNKICKEYIREVKSFFPIKGKSERAYIKKLRSNLEEFCQETDTVTKQDLYENYGKPHEVINDYFSSVDIEYISRKIRISKYVKTLVICLIVAITILTTAMCVKIYKEQEIFAREEMVYADEVIE